MCNKKNYFVFRIENTGNVAIVEKLEKSEAVWLRNELGRYKPGMYRFGSANPEEVTKGNLDDVETEIIDKFQSIFAATEAVCCEDTVTY